MLRRFSSSGCCIFAAASTRTAAPPFASQQYHASWLLPLLLSPHALFCVSAPRLTSSSDSSRDQKREMVFRSTLKHVLDVVSAIRSDPAFSALSRRNGGGGGGSAAASGGKQSRALFEWRHRFGAEVPRLTTAHFDAMTAPQMLTVMHVAAVLAPVSGSSHVAAGVSAALPARLREQGRGEGGRGGGVDSLSPLVETVIRLLRLQQTAARRRRHTEASINETALSTCVALLTERLTSYFGEQNALRKHHEEAMAKTKKNSARPPPPASPAAGDGASSSTALGFHDDSALLRRVLTGFVACFNDRACSHLFHESSLRELTHHLLFATAAMAKSQEQVASSASSGRVADVKPAPPPPLFYGPVISVLAMTLCRLRMFDESVAGFFVWAAPICIAEADLLSGPQLSYILEAFSLVRYPRSDVFLALGQKAGDLGELLRENEVARVLNAMSRTGIEHSRLRSSLESSMRMKTLTKRTSHTTTMR